MPHRLTSYLRGRLGRGRKRTTPARRSGSKEAPDAGADSWPSQLGRLADERAGLCRDPDETIDP